MPNRKPKLVTSQRQRNMDMQTFFRPKSLAVWPILQKMVYGLYLGSTLLVMGVIRTELY